MCKINFIIFLLILVFWGNMCIAKASDNYIPVRVGISDNKFSTYLYNSIEFNNLENTEIMDSSSGYSVEKKANSKIVKVTLENNLFRIYLDGELIAKNLSGPILVRPKEGSFVSVNNLKRKGKQAFYRGFIELIRSEKDISKFAMVNVLSLRNYLRGVVPNEMPIKFGLEALKAQTVAARNYAVAPRVKAYKEFDLCDSVACQVYFGANTEEELANTAIEQTNGVIAADENFQPILALYSSTAGGYTESYEFAFSDPSTKKFPAENISYLSAVPDKKEFDNLNTDEAAEIFYTSQPESFDDLSPYYRWSKEWSVEELENVLAKTLQVQSKTGFVYPSLEKAEDFGHIISIKTLQRGLSGKIIRLEIRTDKNIFIVEKELVIRRCFQKDGISLPSANFVITKIDSQNPVYKFSGGGFGHGVGLSQWGAGKMASLGYTYDEILQHYYSGVTLLTIPVRIRGNFKTVDQLFYCSKEEAKIFIDNPEKIKKLKITVNSKEIDIKLKNEKETIDISKYINQGLNIISYLITSQEAKYTNFLTASIIVKEAANE